jgi:hypothetical protein
MKKEIFKVGDKFKVTACYFQVEGWTDGSPCVILSPVLKYLEYSDCADNAVEDFLLDLVMDGGKIESEDEETVNDALKIVGKSLTSVKRKVSEALKSKTPPFKNVHSQVITTEVELINNEEDGGLDWKILSETKI